MSRAAMQQALDYIEEVDYGPYDKWPVIAALKQALAEPEQEPVAWVEPKWLDPDTRGWPSDSFESLPIEGWLPLYTAPTPRQWVSLTEQEMYDLFFHDQYGPRLPEYLVNTIKCVEAALKEKNNG